MWRERETTKNTWNPRCEPGRLQLHLSPNYNCSPLQSSKRFLLSKITASRSTNDGRSLQLFTNDPAEFNDAMVCATWFPSRLTQLKPTHWKLKIIFHISLRMPSISLIILSFLHAWINPRESVSKITDWRKRLWPSRTTSQSARASAINGEEANNRLGFRDIVLSYESLHTTTLAPLPIVEIKAAYEKNL